MADFTAPPIPEKISRPGDYEWATYIKDRRPQFKVHRTVGHAHAALTNKVSRWRSPRTVTTDIVLYQLECGQWTPQLQLAEGSMITHFPWQEEPPSPEEQRRERSVSQVRQSLDSVIFTAQRELEGELRDRVLTELRSARAKVLHFIQAG
jgi:hypothetical protein